MSDLRDGEGEIKAVPKFSFNASKIRVPPESTSKQLRDHDRHRRDEKRDGQRERHRERDHGNPDSGRRHSSHTDHRSRHRSPDRTSDSFEKVDENGKWAKLGRSTESSSYSRLETAPSKSSATRPRNTTGIAKLDLTDKQLFVVDTKRDLDNLEYGKPSKYSVPRLRHGFEVQAQDNDDEYKSVRQSWAIPREAKRIKLDTEIDNASLFIPLSRRKRVNNDGSTNAYKRFGEESEESDLTSDDEVPVHTESTRKIMELTRAVDDYPHAAQNWHRLANALSAAAPYGSTARVRDEIAFSVYEKAIAANPGETSLTVAYMDLYENLKGKYFTGKKWQEILSSYPDVNEFWTAWMMFNMRDATKFDYTEMVETLTEVVSRIMKGAKDSNSSEESLVYCVFLAVHFIYESGYVEHAIAVVQGLITLNYLCPDTIPLESRLKWLEDFWISDEVRIGDSENIEVRPENDEWLSLELCASKHILPVHVSAADGMDDPFRVILYSDIAPLMIRFDSHKTNMLWMVFKFLGCKVPHSCDYLEKYPIKFVIDENSDGTDDLEHVIDVAFVSRLVSKLIDVVEDEELLECMLRWQYRVEEPPVSQKFAKALLKKRRESVKLWCAYAELEWSLDTAHAETVFVAAANAGGIPVWCRWLECALFSDRDDVLEILCGIAEGKKAPVTPTGIEKTRQILSGMNDISSIKCYAVLEYLTTSITAAVKILNDFAVDDRTPEEVVVFGARLLQHHSTHAQTFKVATMRDYLKAGIRMYPGNQTLLTILARTERRYRIDDVVNSVLTDDAVMASATPWTWRLAVWFYSELGNTGMARSILEKAVMGKGRMNASTWMGYVSFENEYKAKQVLWRAISTCPWNRDIILEGIRRSDSERRVLLELLLERGLRVRVEIPESLVALQLANDDKAEVIESEEEEVEDLF